MGKIYHSIVELVGNTPLLELDNYEKKLGLHAHILAKLEYYNPAGSVKDRIALGMIQAAERDGSLEGKTTLVEMTTGNTGIGIAAIAAAKALTAWPDAAEPEGVDAAEPDELKPDKVAGLMSAARISAAARW